MYHNRTVEVSTPYCKKIKPKIKDKSLIKIPKKAKQDYEDGNIVLVDKVIKWTLYFYKTPKMDIEYITKNLTDWEYRHLMQWASKWLTEWNVLNDIYWKNISQSTFNKCMSKYKKVGAVRKIKWVYYLNPVIMQYYNAMNTDIIELFEDVNKPNWIDLYKYELYSNK